MSAWFVTGTDTEVGKSLVSAALIHRFAEAGRRSAGMKPIAAGAVRVGDAWYNEDVALLAAAGNVKLAPELACPYLLKEAAAPHIAAALEDAHFDLAHIQRCFDEIASQADTVIVEGVGGFRVPLTADSDTSDLAMQLNLPVILVVGMRLGCLNHALLTAEAIKARGLRLVGWVANQIDPAMRHIAANLEALENRLPAPLLGYIPHLLPAGPHTAADHLNIELLS